MRPKVYLAGPITGLTYAGCTDWREHARNRLNEVGINGVSPMRAKHYLEELSSISGTGEEYSQHVLSSQKSVLTRDRYDTRTANVVLMNLLDSKRVSIGTMIEMGWADAYRVPIVLVIEDGGVEENYHHHMMVREAAGFILHDLEEAISTCISILQDNA